MAAGLDILISLRKRLRLDRPACSSSFQVNVQRGIVLLVFFVESAGRDDTNIELKTNNDGQGITKNHEHDNG